MEGFSTRWPLSRLIASDKAKEKGINNTPPDALLGNLARLSRTMHKIEEELAKQHPKARIWIESGYRCAALNKEVGGSATSAHMSGLAADIKVDGITVLELANFIKSVVTDFDQLIYEFGRWAHLGVKGDKAPRRELLTATKNSRRKTVYTPGLPQS